MSPHAAGAGARIAYEERGAGRPLLLLHGLGYGRWGWEPVADALAARFRVLLVDNRGIGSSDAPPGPYSARMLAADAVAVLDAAGVERAAIAGASLGAMVALELGLGWPARVQRLVLAGTTPGGAGAYPLPPATAALLDGAARPGLRELVANAFAPGAPPELVDRVVAHRRAAAQDPAAWHAQAAASRTFDALDRLPAVAAPTLVLQGAEDRIVDPRNAALLGARIQDARVEVLDGAGHLLFWERPERFVELVAGFLA